MYLKALVIPTVTLYHYWKASSIGRHESLPPTAGGGIFTFPDMLLGKARYILPAAILSISHILSAFAHNMRSTNICPLMVFSANVVPWLQFLAVALDAWALFAIYSLAETAYKASLAPKSIGYTLLVRTQVISHM